jgi:hypothetical protein
MKTVSMRRRSPDGKLTMKRVRWVGQRIGSLVEAAFFESVLICVNLRINCIPEPCSVDIGSEREFIRRLMQSYGG